MPRIRAQTCCAVESTLDRGSVGLPLATFLFSIYLETGVMANFIHCGSDFPLHAVMKQSKGSAATPRNRLNLPPNPGAPNTEIPSSLAALRSIDAFLIPVVSTTLRFGNACSSSAGSGVRSRIVEITSKGLSLSRSLSRFSAEVVDGALQWYAGSVSGNVLIWSFPGRESSRREK